MSNSKLHYIEEIKQFVPSCEQEETDKRIVLKAIEQNPSTILTRENEIAHITCSGFTMNKQFDKVLMVYHNIYQSWSWTGGHADGEDNFLEVAKREVKEETSVTHLEPFNNDILSIDVLTVKGHKKKGIYVAPHLHLNITYLFVAEETNSIQMKPDENSGVKWIPVNELDCYVEEKEMLPVYYKLIKKTEQFRQL